MWFKSLPIRFHKFCEPIGENEKEKDEEEKKKENEERKSGRIHLPVSLSLLVISQIFLIFFVCSIIGMNYRKHSTFSEDSETWVSDFVDERMSKREIGLDSVIVVSPEKYSVLLRESYDKAFSYLAGRMTGIESKFYEGNSFVSILLAIITLCITLSVIIPYILSEAAMRNAIKAERRVVEKQYDQLIEDKFNEALNETKFNLKELNRAESHLSRMIGYLLRYKNNTTNSPERVKEIGWSIGWTAKSMIRYIKASDDNSFHAQKFFDDCQMCICSTKSIIKNLEIDSDPTKRDLMRVEDKALRAFIDLFDVFQFLKYRPSRLKLTKEKELLDLLKLLYSKLSVFYGNNLKSTISEALEIKAKHKEYLPNEIAFIKKAHNWLKENHICDDNWDPVN